MIRLFSIYFLYFPSFFECPKMNIIHSYSYQCVWIRFWYDWKCWTLNFSIGCWNNGFLKVLFTIIQCVFNSPSSYWSYLPSPTQLKAFSSRFFSMSNCCSSDNECEFSGFYWNTKFDWNVIGHIDYFYIELWPIIMQAILNQLFFSMENVYVCLDCIQFKVIHMNQSIIIEVMMLLLFFIIMK